MVAVRSGGGTEEDGYNLILLQGRGADDPNQYARVTLAECRKSCRVTFLTLSFFVQLLDFQDLYQNLTTLTAMIEKYGGLEDYIVDPFGFEYPLCAGNGGFTSTGRCLLLTNNVS